MNAGSGWGLGHEQTGPKGFSNRVYLFADDSYSELREIRFPPPRYKLWKRGDSAFEWGAKIHAEGAEPTLKLFLQLCRASPGEWLLFIPHWLTLLSFALPWLALLVWRARRRARLPSPAP